MFRIRSLLLLLVLTAVFINTATAETQLLRHVYPKLRNTTVEVNCTFGVAARNGALPFRVNIINNTGADRVWNVEISEGNSGRTLRTVTDQRVEVRDGATVETEIILPFAPEFTAYSYRNVFTKITSPGLPSVERNTGYQTVTNIPTIAMSQRLGQRSLSTLDKTVKQRNSNDPRFANSYNPQQLSTDWRAYTALDYLLIDLESWRQIDQAQRRAILEWVRLGGILDIFGTEDDLSGHNHSTHFDALKIEGLLHTRPTHSYARLSLGIINLKKWNGNEVDSTLTADYRSSPYRSQEITNNYDTSWDLADDFGSRNFNNTLIFVLLLIFAILVAPVNLFYFAAPGKRHRLFVTTPIISLAACVIVILIIFFSDGLGGRGYRIAFADLQSGGGEMRLYITQEQVSRTGVMIRTDFENERIPAIDPVNLRDSEFNTLKPNSGTNLTFRYDRERYNGGFFRSRSEQGFSLRAVEPTRARIEQTGTQEDGAPKLVSSFPSTIEKLVYHAPDGTYWSTPENKNIAPGSPIPLEPVAKEIFKEWVGNFSTSFSDRLRKRTRFLANEPGRFFAISSKSSDLFLETHGGIDWETEKLLLSGNVIGVANSPGEPSTDAAPASTDTPSPNE